MKISSIKIQNFRGYKELSTDLNPSFNLFIGDNGSGKTAILEALTIAIGSFFLGIKGMYSKGFTNKDIRIATFNHNEEYSFPVVVDTSGTISDQTISWKRTLDSPKGRTTQKDADQLKDIAIRMDEEVRQGKQLSLPLLIYYATGRLFDISENEDEEKENGRMPSIASRFRAYNKSLDAKSNYKQFQDWFKGKEMARIQKSSPDITLELVKSTIVKSLPNCANIFYEFDPDKPQGMRVELKDGRTLPFGSLSDGTRNFFAIVADMAYKCVTLNPHLKEKALEETEGVVLIDELDLHLHPVWQRKIIKVLTSVFPKVQFIATTHSPFLIQETGPGQLIILKNNKIHKVTSGTNLSIEDIAEELQYVINPQWSKSRQEMFKKAKEYYSAVREGRDTPEMKAELDEVMKPFALDTAYYAIVEQEKIIAEHKKVK